MGGAMRASMVARALRRFQAPMRRRRASQREEQAPLGESADSQVAIVTKLMSAFATSNWTTKLQTPGGTNTAEVATSSTFKMGRFQCGVGELAQKLDARGEGSQRLAALHHEKNVFELSLHRETSSKSTESRYHLTDLLILAA